MQIKVIKYFLTLVLDWMSFNSRQFISTPLLTYIQALLSLVGLLAQKESIMGVLIP